MSKGSIAMLKLYESSLSHRSVTDSTSDTESSIASAMVIIVHGMEFGRSISAHVIMGWNRFLHL